MSKKLRALDLLLRRGLIADEKEARACLMAGQVYSGSRRIAGASEMLPIDCELHVRGMDKPFVSKGGLKLSGAIRDFGIDVTGRVCIDAGASTGGFTDCLVKSGAALVYAVEVGFGQLAGSLSQNPRVVNLEKTNLGDEKLLALDPKPDLGSMDLSYLSIEKAVPLYRAIMGGQGEVLCLVKPLFEVDDPEARRTGEIAPEKYLPLLLRLIDTLNRQENTAVLDVTCSPVTGNNGTHEFFLRTVFGHSGPVPQLDEKAAQAVEAVLTLPKYHKEF